MSLHLFGEGAHDIERDIGLKERPADLAQGGVHVCLGQGTATSEPVKDAAEPFGKRVEHVSSTVGARGRIALSGGRLRPRSWNRSAGDVRALFESEGKIGTRRS